MQIILQFPSAFEYTTEMLYHVGWCAMSGWFGTFLNNSEKSRRCVHAAAVDSASLGSALRRWRREHERALHTVSVWAVLHAHRAVFTNPSYVATSEVRTAKRGCPARGAEPPAGPQILQPISSVKKMALWTQFYLRCAAARRSRVTVDAACLRGADTTR